MSDRVRAQIRAAAERMGVRVAVACPRPECSWREFDNERAVCPSHGESVRQPNRPYFGEQT